MPAGPGPITGSCFLAAFLFQSVGVGPLRCSSLPKGLAWSRGPHWPVGSGASHRPAYSPAAMPGLLAHSLQAWGCWQEGRFHGAFACGTRAPFMATACARPHPCWGEGLKALASLTCARPILAGSPNGHDSGGARVLTPAPRSCPRASPCDYG